MDDSSTMTPMGQILPTTQQVDAELARERKRRGHHASTGRLLAILATVFAVTVLVSQLAAPMLRACGTFMEPTLQEGDVVVAWKPGSFTTGDLIAFSHNNQLLVKRVIAGPSDWVDIDSNGNVTVNGQALAEDYLPAGEKALGTFDISLPYQVPDGCYDAPTAEDQPAGNPANSDEPVADPTAPVGSAQTSADQTAVVVQTPESSSYAEFLPVESMASVVKRVSLVAPRREAAATSNDLSQYLTNGTVVMKLENGVWVSTTEVKEGDKIKVSLAYNFPAGVVTKDNRTFTYTVPDGVRPNSDQSGFVTDPNGNEIGTYTIGADGTIKGQDSGSVHFGGDATDVTITKPEQQDTRYDIHSQKTGTLSEDHTTADYVVTISTTKGTGDPVGIGDSIDKGNSTNTNPNYDRNSLVVYKVGTDGSRTPVSLTDYPSWVFCTRDGCGDAVKRPFSSRSASRVRVFRRLGGSCAPGTHTALLPTGTSHGKRHRGCKSAPYRGGLLAPAMCRVALPTEASRRECHRGCAVRSSTAYCYLHEQIPQIRPAALKCTARFCYRLPRMGMGLMQRIYRPPRACKFPRRRQRPR